MNSVLPKLSKPKYEVRLLSTGQVIEYEPMVVKQEKRLHAAAETQEPKAVLRAVCDIINECVVGPIKSLELPVFDVISLFINIRINSIGGKVKPSIVCPSCKESFQVEVDLNEIKPIIDETHTKEVDINDDIAIEMRYPTAKDVISGMTTGTDVDELVIIAKSIEKIWKKDGSETFNAADLNDRELIDFVENVPISAQSGFETFFKTMPKIRYEIVQPCEHCSETVDIQLETVEDFFV